MKERSNGQAWRTARRQWREEEGGGDVRAPGVGERKKERKKEMRGSGLGWAGPICWAEQVGLCREERREEPKESSVFFQSTNIIKIKFILEFKQKFKFGCYMG